MDRAAQKRKVAQVALEYIEDAMILGLGSGSTAAVMIEGLGERVAQGLSITAVATSVASHTQAEALGIEVLSLDEVEVVDLLIDGADEVTRAGSMIKGGGGALLREKVVAAMSSRCVYMVDESKLVERLGAFTLPVEVVPFASAPIQRRMLAIGAKQATLRSAGEGAFETDNGNWILDVDFGLIEPAREQELAAMLDATPGVVEHGLFLGLADVVIAAVGEEIERWVIAD